MFQPTGGRSATSKPRLCNGPRGTPRVGAHRGIGDITTVITFGVFGPTRPRLMAGKRALSSDRGARSLYDTAAQF